MRIGYYRDTYVRTADGWRLQTRAMTFIRRNGDHDHGQPHAIGQAGCGMSERSERIMDLACRSRACEATA